VTRDTVFISTQATAGRDPPPLIEEISFVDPLAVLALLADQSHVLFLDSAASAHQSNNWSYILADPFAVLTHRAGTTLVNEHPIKKPALATLHAELAALTWQENLSSQLPFCGGAAGYLGYELAGELETLPAPKNGALGFPDMVMGLYDAGLAFNMTTKQAFLFSTGLPFRQSEGKRRQAERAWFWRLQATAAHNITLLAASHMVAKTRIQARFTRQDYESAIRRVIEYIYAGDVFQANLAQAFHGEIADTRSPLDIYLQLRKQSPAPYAAFMRFGNYAILSSSPEQFICLDASRQVITRPIKGTRSRGATESEDAVLAAALMTSEKDRAENVMIVDLLRNDLSRVCEDFSVRVENLCALESYAQVHHLVSTVKGKLRAECNAIDLLRAVFPGGSITGAPKIRAMEIIAELEPERRGPYCGALGYIGFNGTMNLNIAIRTMIMRARQFSFHVGGGIVAQSQPGQEYEETLTKARGIMASLNAADPYIVDE
jgi:para-aminobenzoate synthetase component 1